MSGTSGKILIIDDDPAFVRTYQTVLGAEGYAIDTASDRRAALTSLEHGSSYSVVLLDQKLQGRDGSDSGIDLLGEIQRLAPQAKTIIITAFATEASIQRAFALGAYDFLEKGPVLEPLLRAKVRNAAEVFHERHLGRLDAVSRDQQIHSAWQEVQSETDPHRKGALLEDLLVLVFRAIPGFHEVSRGRKNPLEEIDIFLRNESSDPLWTKEGPFILAECKHWTRPVGARELREFAEKLRRRHHRSRLGLFISMSDFTAPFREEIRRLNATDLLILPISRSDLANLVSSGDRNATLKRLYEGAVVDQSGDAK